MDSNKITNNKINNNEVLTLSVEDAAIQAGFSRSSMYNWCKKNANEIPFKVVSLGRSLRIEKNSFYEWIYGTKMVS
jgi:predicted DNA-binding transcriptional regulator AlpA